MTLTPAADIPAAEAASVVAGLRGTGFLALTGAGMSTDSGIPDYRGPRPAGSAQQADRTPMTYQEFVSGASAQQRYWARAFLGWSRMGHATSNRGHEALAGLESDRVCHGVITQNVDGLHEHAGSGTAGPLVALHGRIADVVCLACGDRSPRTAMQARMDAANPGWADRHLGEHGAAPVRPDGDADTDDTVDFVVPGCPCCGGVLKPDVVFFGENVPRDRVERCYALVDQACERGAALLVLGSSLTVMSGLRFVRHAAKRGMGVVIVNRGPTRGDPFADHRLHDGTTEFLTHPLWYH